MPEFFGIEVSSEMLLRYDQTDLDYKDQAREIICRELGYNPPYQLSAYCELCIRDALRRLDRNIITQECLDDIIQFQSHVAQTVLMEYAQAGTV